MPVFRRVAVPVVAALGVGSAALLGAGISDAHVSASSTSVTRGGYGVVTLVVPNESDTAATTSLSVEVPHLKSARTEAVPGWRAVIDKDAKTGEAVRVTWTAVDGNAGVKVGEFGQFNIAGGPFPDEATVNLPAVQTYANGEVVNWNQPMTPGGDEPEHPAPALSLTAGAGGHSHGGVAQQAESDHNTDDTARWIGGIGLILGALGVVFGVGAMARSRRTSTAGDSDA